MCSSGFVVLLLFSLDVSNFQWTTALTRPHPVILQPVNVLLSTPELEAKFQASTTLALFGYSSLRELNLVTSPVRWSTTQLIQRAMEPNKVRCNARDAYIHVSLSYKITFRWGWGRGWEYTDSGGRCRFLLTLNSSSGKISVVVTWPRHFFSSGSDLM